MKITLKTLIIHFFAIALFIIAALAYFSPVLQGKKIFQSDIAQYTGMAKEQNDFRKKTDSEPYWTNSAFGGMPTYQLGANYPHNYVKKLDKVIRFLPRPADYLFLYFIGFYILLCCLKVDYRLAVLGALGFGFSTYLIIILGVGHNAKAHALGYLPILLGGIILVFRKKYLWGFLLTAIAMALEISANHYQMTYYFMLLVLILGIAYLVDAIKKKKLKHYFASVGILILAVTLGVLANATNLMATKEYAAWSTRGKSELTINPDGSKLENTDGLDRNYITHYSYGITESLNLIAPRLFGGSDREDLGKDSRTYKYLTEQGLSTKQAMEFTSNLPLYWGGQPGTAGPAYVGVILFFLFVLGLIIVKGKSKWWLLGGVLMSLLLSWGKNFGVLTDFMIDYFPMYNKFRAVSSIQVILELCVPILAILALMELFRKRLDSKKKLNSLKLSFAIVGGVLITLILTKGMFLFEGGNDEVYKRSFGDDFLDMMRLDRKDVYTNDLLRSLVYLLLAAVTIWFFVKDKIKKNVFVLLLGGLILLDLVGVGRRYVNDDDFVRARQMDAPFKATNFDKQIASDKGVYRVYDPSEELNGARTSYFHQSIGGYHAAKPAGMQDLFNFHIYKGNIKVLNMLNVRYVIQQDEDGRSYPARNPEANGNAWFVDRLKKVTNADEEIMALDSINIKTEAIFNATEFPKVSNFNFERDSTAGIHLKTYEPNHLTYTSSSANAGLAVFSEMYYGNGWNAKINGKLVDHFKVNYVLRALEIPAGDHTIEFSFEPEVVETGSKIALGSSIALGVIAIGGIVFSLVRSRKKEKE